MVVNGVAPSRERGLKSGGELLEAEKQGRSFAGAWIEIKKGEIYYEERLCRSFAGA